MVADERVAGDAGAPGDEGAVRHGQEQQHEVGGHHLAKGNRGSARGQGRGAGWRSAQEGGTRRGEQQDISGHATERTAALLAGPYPSYSRPRHTPPPPPHFSSRFVAEVALAKERLHSWPSHQALRPNHSSTPSASPALRPSHQ